MEGRAGKLRWCHDPPSLALPTSSSTSSSLIFFARLGLFVSPASRPSQLGVLDEVLLLPRQRLSLARRRLSQRSGRHVTRLWELLDDDILPVSLRLVLEGDDALALGVEGVVVSHADVVARVELGASLPDDDAAGGDVLPSVDLHAEPLAVGVPPVLRGTASLLVRALDPKRLPAPRATHHHARRRHAD
eukprot:CAMPEP_0197492556 /NCGR_PEP_ID=MMETSP1311-20131121/11068_1 /TAXON_ID=464262 /ORGANISM="Genus nov. species nov., Strain RCC856" /LENGTH=188 /DNA_ID=CAMNT_0043037545 /DNA_START=73 /DNA_END=639 /DNA_ORIENTATION=-